KHTAAGIPTWSPTVVLICRSTAYVWQSGRDAQFSADCGRMCSIRDFKRIYYFGCLITSLITSAHALCIHAHVMGEAVLTSWVN
ncbi:uncharacterized protein M437DRAFT_44725, partial [Aureobasidium melanogenum CBS 110374]